MEEIDEDEDEQNRNPLPGDIEQILMTENELNSLSKEGEKRGEQEPRDKKQSKPTVEQTHKSREQSKPTVKCRKKPIERKNSIETSRNEWIKDPRMPNEFNELVSTMWAHQQQFVNTNERYRQLDPNEASDPVEFVAYLYPSGVEKEKPGKEPQFRLPSIDDSIASIEKLKREYEPVRNERKGVKRPIKEDSVRLRQQWHDEFIDILQGTKEELPPL